MSNHRTPPPHLDPSHMPGYAPGEWHGQVQRGNVMVKPTQACRRSSNFTPTLQTPIVPNTPSVQFALGGLLSSQPGRLLFANFCAFLSNTAAAPFWILLYDSLVDPLDADRGIAGANNVYPKGRPADWTVPQRFGDVAGIVVDYLPARTETGTGVDPDSGGKALGGLPFDVGCAWLVSTSPHVFLPVPNDGTVLLASAASRWQR